MSGTPGNGQAAQQQTAATQNAVMALFSRLKEVAAGVLAEVRDHRQVVVVGFDARSCTLCCQPHPLGPHRIPRAPTVPC